MGGINISSLLSSIQYSNSYNYHSWIISISRCHLGINGDPCLFKFVFKPDSLLLEDTGSKTTSEEHDKADFVFVKLGLKLTIKFNKIYINYNMLHLLFFEYDLIVWFGAVFSFLRNIYRFVRWVWNKRTFHGQYSLTSLFWTKKAVQIHLIARCTSVGFDSLQPFSLRPIVKEMKSKMLSIIMEGWEVFSSKDGQEYRYFNKTDVNLHGTSWACCWSHLD